MTEFPIEPPKDSRSIDELFSAACDWTKEDGEGDWSAVNSLHWLGTREVFDQALKLTEAGDLRLRARGADILGQLGIPERVFVHESVDAMIRLLNNDDADEVIQSAAVAIHHLRDLRGTDAIVAHAAHADPDVRRSIAFSLGGNSEPQAIRALIELTRDPDSDVRDWATFGLGDIGEVNTPEVREALYDRLSDDDADTRFEAVCGLARCRDFRGLPTLIDWFEQNSDNSFLHEAAVRLLGLDWSADYESGTLITMLRALPAQ